MVTHGDAFSGLAPIRIAGDIGFTRHHASRVTHSGAIKASPPVTGRPSPQPTRAPVAKMSRLTYTRGMSDDPTVVELRPRKPVDPELSRKRREAGAKGLATVKRTNHKPARGGPPSGIPASGMPASGLPSLGLPALGEINGTIDVHRGPDAPRRTREAMKLAAMAAMEAAIDDLNVPAVAKALIAEKILNRLEGMPTQMTVVADMGDVSNLTADERSAEMADLERRLARE